MYLSIYHITPIYAISFLQSADCRMIIGTLLIYSSIGSVINYLDQNHRGFFNKMIY